DLFETQVESGPDGEDGTFIVHRDNSAISNARYNWSWQATSVEREASVSIPATTTTYQYDGYGRVDYVIAPNPAGGGESLEQTTTYNYGDNGFLTGLSGPGIAETIVYNPVPLSSGDEPALLNYVSDEVHSLTLDYDSNGFVTDTYDGDGHKTFYLY